MAESSRFNCRTWEHSGFSVHAAEPTADEDSLRFIARYLRKPAVALERIVIVNNGLATTVHLTKQLDDGDLTRELAPLEFLAELSTHIPNVWEQTVRYYGCYSSRFRAKEGKNPEVPPAENPPRSASSSWAAAIKQIFEIDPLTCPNCGAPMKIVAFIRDSREILKLTKHLGISAWKAPPDFSRPTC